ncbi:MAG: helix-turn-helix domain-containing protein [Lachnospiraceae bacterium]|nr:helix-turn-helix domain-containing protein [Lachnospiraceae bacterium]
MYKILIADNDNETEEYIKSLLKKYFNFDFEIKVAKTGRQALELVEVFCPDIIFIDLQIPGINGIEVMREVRNIHKNINMVIISACTKFDYVREAIGIGVLEYITKPFEKEISIDVLEKIFLKVGIEKERRSYELEWKEKMEMIIPIIENDFIYYLLYGIDKKENLDYFCELLGIGEEAGYIMLLQCEDLTKGELCKYKGSIHKQLKMYFTEIKYVIRKYFQGCIVSMIENRIMIFVSQKQISQEEEIDLYNCIKENARKMIMECKGNFKLKFKLGFGRIYEIDNLSVSYDEAIQVLEYNAASSVVHINDLPGLCDITGNYPMNIEAKLFKSIEVGNTKDAIHYSKQIFEWAINFYERKFMDIKMKVLEYILCAEAMGTKNGCMTIGLISRGKYLEEIIEMQNFQQLEFWFKEKIVQVCKNNYVCEKIDSIDIVKKAKEFIQLNYAKDIDLNEVAAYLQISPYYFSKLFKKRTGKNFIEYLTQVRMEHAKNLLKNSTKSMKEICIDIGYSDANYFSRTFKKNIGISPTEYKKERYGA